MARFRRVGAEGAPADIAMETAHKSGGGGHLTAVISVLALLFSGYSLWDSSLRGPHLKLFVPPVMQYSSPYNNTNFEVFELPVTFVNDGGRTGTILSMDLEVTNPKTNETKRFYAADFGRWTMEKTRANGYEPFAPISLAGKASRSQTVLFYTNGPAQKPEQLVHEPGTFNFKLTIDEAKADDFGPLDRLFGGRPTQLSFAMELREYDARAFQNGTLALYSVDGRSAKAGDAPTK